MLSEQLNLRHGTPQHREIKDAVKARADYSRNRMQGRHEEWRKAEELHRAYIPESEADAKRRQSREAGQPQPMTLVVPYSYASLMAAHTYWTSVFLSRDPVMQYTARHGESQMQVQAVEAVQDYQLQTGGNMVPLYIWLLDPGKYGVGILGQYWDEEQSVVSRIVEEEVPETFNGVPLVGRFRKERRRVVERRRGYQGSRYFNVRPFDFLPDPRVPMHLLQKGEFCGRVARASWMEIVRGAQEGRYIADNVKVLRKRRSGTRQDQEGDSADYEVPMGEQEAKLGEDVKDVGYVELIEMYIELIPREWKLGDTEYPEKWVFTLAEGEILIGAAPLGEYHNKFPFFPLEYETDGYALFNRGMYEVMEPMQNLLDWLINTHFYSVRKVLNDMMIVDPSRVVMKDLLTPGPGKIIRAKPSVYGQDVRTAIHQLQVGDVTQQHLQDAQLVIQMMQRVTGVNDNVMGALNPGGRKTATEVRQSNTLGINRLKTTAEWWSAQGWTPLSQVSLQSTQQHYDAEQQFRIAGSMVGAERPFVQVDPSMIMGFYDFVAVDGTMPIDRYAQVNLWTQLLGQLKQFPDLLAGYDMPKLFAWIAQLAGLKNVNQFRVQTMPDQQAAQQAQAGNLVPLQGGGGSPRRPPDATAGPVPTRPPGMGATG